MQIEKIDLMSSTVGLYRDGSSSVEPSGNSRPRRIDGFVVGAAMVSGVARHNGEMHPDADEVLFLVSGSVDVLLEVDGGEQVLPLEVGDACVVPKGVWHRIRLRDGGQPSQLIHITPGPGGEWRPLSQA
jgi:mannose-6-phosphate isomerase-like protein (cupin superfamily)